jgi:molecular chaperone GrpE
VAHQGGTWLAPRRAQASAGNPARKRILQALQQRDASSMTERSNQDRNPEEEAALSGEGAEQASASVGTGAAESREAEADGGEAQDGAHGPPSGDELKALRDRYLRLAAEYDNFRKRTEKERVESWTRAQAQLVQQLLDPLDDLQRVAHYQAESTNVQALLDGVQMVERKLLRLLESAGLEVLDASGQPFDPSVHEALMTAPAERQEDDESVGEVFQKGYRFKGDLVRPARVQVRKYGG